MSGLFRRIRGSRPAAPEESSQPTETAPARPAATRSQGDARGGPFADPARPGDARGGLFADPARPGDAPLDPQPSAPATGDAPLGDAAFPGDPAPGAGEPLLPAPIPAATAPAPTVDPALAAYRDLPAGLDPDELRREIDTKRRGRVRRRLRYLERARHLLLRDLGGLVYELQRSGGRPEGEQALVDAKVRRLLGLDAEARGLRDLLGSEPGETVLREPGIGGACPRCGELFASEANFCASCGLPVSERARRRAQALAAAGECGAAGEPQDPAGEDEAAGGPRSAAGGAASPGAETAGGRREPDSEPAEARTQVLPPEPRDEAPGEGRAYATAARVPPP
jgi:hypothetical protein